MDQVQLKDNPVQTICRLLDHNKQLKPPQYLLKTMLGSIIPFDPQRSQEFEKIRRVIKLSKNRAQYFDQHLKPLEQQKLQIEDQYYFDDFQQLKKFWTSNRNEKTQMFYLIDIIQYMWVELRFVDVQADEQADEQADTIVQQGQIKSWLHEYFQYDKCLLKFYQIIIDHYCRTGGSNCFKFHHKIDTQADILGQTNELLELLNSQSYEISQKNDQLIDKIEIEKQRQKVLIDKKEKKEKSMAYQLNSKMIIKQK